MSGVSDSRLLVASHIVPWASDQHNRLNPRNGLCLSALHDRAFDKGLITLNDDYEIIISNNLKNSKDKFIQDTLLPLEGRQIELPERFSPLPEFLEHHRNQIFSN
jgi:predicted restriction endonuclease